MTDSSTGGFLAPELDAGISAFYSPAFGTAFSVTPVPLPLPPEDRDLYEVLQETVVGVSGMDPTLVRPRWQPEPSPIPTAAICWCALGVTDLESDMYPFVGQLPDGSWQLQRHETFTMYCSFFDLGYGGVAGRQAAILRDGLMVPQNREALADDNIYLVSDADLEVEPTLFKTRWRVQVDLRVRLRRQITRHYAVRPLLTASVNLYTDDGQPTRIIQPLIPVTPPSPDIIPPSVPTNLVGVPTVGEVTLTWTASTDNVAVTGYNIYRDGVQIGSSATASYVDVTVLGSTIYSYEVSAFDAAGNESARTVPITVTTPGVAPQAPGAPTGQPLPF